MSSDNEAQLSAVRRRVDDLKEYQIPRLAEYHGPAEGHRELCAEIRGDLERVRRGVEVRSTSCSYLD